MNVVLLQFLIAEGKFSEEILKTQFSPLEWTIEQFENIDDDDDDDAAAVAAAAATPVGVVTFSHVRDLFSLVLLLNQ